MRVNSSRLLFSAFAAVVASFVASGVLEQYASRDVDLASDAIVSNAAPSIEHLAALRSEVWQSEFLLGDWLEKHASGQKADDAAVEASLQRLTAENERLRERRADELESFSGRVAHDILSPLQAVRFSLSAAARSADQKVAESLARGERALKRVEALTDGLLAFARAAAKPEPGACADVREVVEGVVDELREEACQGRVSLLVQPLPNVAVACEPGILTSL